MTITEVRTHRLSAPLHTPFVTALRRTTTSRPWWSRCVDDDGPVRLRRGAAGVAGDRRLVAGAEACVRADARPAAASGATPTTWWPAAPRCGARSPATRRPRPPWTSRCTTWPPAGSAYRWSGCSAAGAADTHRRDPLRRRRRPPRRRRPARVAEGFAVLKLKVGTDAAGRPRPGPRGPRRGRPRRRGSGWTPTRAGRRARRYG